MAWVYSDLAFIHYCNNLCDSDIHQGIPGGVENLRIGGENKEGKFMSFFTQKVSAAGLEPTTS